jgi:hypothetical protein
MNQKDISTWNTPDISSWLKSINMTQYVSKFELNKINGYDLIYLTKEDLKNLGIINIHDKNVILNSMKKALLNQLKLNLNYKNKNITVQLDFDPNYTVEQLIKSLKLIFKPNKEIFLVVNNNEILMPNLKIIDLILYEPKIYKNFRIISDEDFLNNYNNIFPNKEENKKIFSKTPNKTLYYNNDFEKEYKNVEKSNRYTNSMATGDNLENLYNKKKYGLEKNLLKNYSNNIGINLDNANDEYYSNYKTYNDFNKIKALKKDEFDNNININNKINNDINNNYYENKYIKETNMNNNNNLYEIKTANNLNKNNTNIYDYKKNYSIKNGELNLEIKNLDLNKINREENDGQRYSSEKRNYRLKELKLNRNYGNNLDGNNIYLGKNNYNYDLNNINGIKDDRMNYTSGTGGFI